MNECTNIVLKKYKPHENNTMNEEKLDTIIIINIIVIFVY